MVPFTEMSNSEGLVRCHWCWTLKTCRPWEGVMWRQGPEVFNLTGRRASRGFLILCGADLQIDIHYWWIGGWRWVSCGLIIDLLSPGEPRARTHFRDTETKMSEVKQLTQGQTQARAKTEMIPWAVLLQVCSLLPGHLQATSSFVLYPLCQSLWMWKAAGPDPC